ncbi:hypothetical protein RYX36_037163, partial [Vicia faba]
VKDVVYNIGELIVPKSTSSCQGFSLVETFQGIEFIKTWICVVRLTLAKAGPTFIKWDQWAASSKKNRVGFVEKKSDVRES